MVVRDYINDNPPPLGGKGAFVKVREPESVAWHSKSFVICPLLHVSSSNMTSCYLPSQASPMAKMN